MEEKFDYIVVGGGMAGLAVASRLSEKPELTVLVLEAGETGINNPAISVPGLMVTNLGSDIDWNFCTVPQEGANQRKMSYPRGKVLGGSSAINFMMSSRAEAEDYDAIKRLGNPGWGWTEIERASKKSEKLIIPPTNSPYIFNPESHGRDGPVVNSFPKYIPPQFTSYFTACAAAGHVIQKKDPFAGKLEGAYIYPSAIDDHGSRVTSATAYYFPNQSRTNLVVRTNCEVNKLILKNNGDNSELQVLGVEYSSCGTPFRVLVTKEVIMSAGSIGTPAILERSGIGNEQILKSLNIPVTLNLKGVGFNLSDHVFVIANYRLKPGHRTLEDLTKDPGYAAEQKLIYEQSGGGLFSHPTSIFNFQSLRSIVSEDEMNEGLKLLKNCPSYLSPKQFEAVVDRIMNGVALEFSLVNTFFEPELPSDRDTSYLTANVILQYPLSRGSSHIQSQDPGAAPLIDPKFLMHPFDAWLLAQGAKEIRKIMAQDAHQDIILDEHYPGPSVQTNEQWEESVRRRALTSYHPCGTCSMLPQSESGVVDPQLRVYGTQNLRVVDASILPVQLTSHPAMTVYAIAEKAAEMILNQSN
ncbi:hypothetical protein PTTG_27335 [Puccinia triticina 1-1 BBBD Race 1]|uniref:GMC_OxRdtase_N domain-containing protein n=2 Tax=Puccinia triticina TaxID=208348 RepID=A0A180GM17_PUCT1|nr:uncharacterized protein PtA15_6A170 [Puccinia triticina]OAV93402.1 hypothetical protein PTTG_27335 [Puccinia triticina 1-1 BBBD Race 1]WAQ85542.1 hypothetical protein PtA15_6A170 [Puccinia triticina]WAR55428.1 hypothetical protein PtB15_6B169 [Puccinia triticina]